MRYIFVDHLFTYFACLIFQPHAHIEFTTVQPEAKYFPDLSLEAASNYCRNPTRSDGERPWCYSTKNDTRFEYCDVLECEQTTGKSFKLVVLLNRLSLGCVTSLRRQYGGFRSGYLLTIHLEMHVKHQMSIFSNVPST